MCLLSPLRSPRGYSPPGSEQRKPLSTSELVYWPFAFQLIGSSIDLLRAPRLQIERCLQLSYVSSCPKSNVPTASSNVDFEPKWTTSTVLRILIQIQTRSVTVEECR